MVREGAARLKAAGVANAWHEAEWLLSRLVGSRPLELYLSEVRPSEAHRERFAAQIEARAFGTPLQYLLGEAEFFGRPFTVEPGVFIPRPETEAIVEALLGTLQRDAERLARPLRVLDLGTGSGAIAVTLALELPACAVVGIELSWEALRTASENVRRHGVDRRVALVRGCWLQAVRGEVDAVVSNPPYVPSRQVERLPLDVRQEPRDSLDGGRGGMRHLKRLLEDAAAVVRPGGWLALECGEDHAVELVARSAAAGWAPPGCPVHDLAGRPRGVLLQR